MLKQLDVNSGTGPDHIGARFLRQCRDVLEVPLLLLARVVSVEFGTSSMSANTCVFLLTPDACAVEEACYIDFGQTPSEILFGLASPPPPPASSPGAVVEREFSPEQAYSYTLTAKQQRGVDEFYIAASVGGCVLVDKCEEGWALVTHECGVQGWLPSTCVGR
mgnify:CR=1 FL=1